MPKKTPQKQEKVVSDQDLVSSFLKNKKDDHFNFLEERYYKVSTGSLILDSVLDGGYTPGLHRNVGFNSSGKSSEALEAMRNMLLSVPNAKGVYISAEGRLSKELRERCGINFVNDPKEWIEGTCFVFETNIYEAVAEFMEMLVKRSGDEFYCIILDSVDGLILKNDANKTYDEAIKVAGGPVIASLLMKKIAIPLAKRGHMAFFISQVRADIKLDPYSPAPVRQTSATGGNALLHYANVILQFEPRFKSDMIFANEKEKNIPSLENPPLGHWAKVVIKKSPNEKDHLNVKYPIKYGVKNGSSVWVEKEIVDILLQWEYLERNGAWFSFEDDFFQELSDDGFTIDQKYQGIQSVYSSLEDNKELSRHLFDKFRRMFSGNVIQ